MSIYLFCTKCDARVYSKEEIEQKHKTAYCLAVDSHRAERYIKYRADFMLGGYHGKRLRPLFDTKKDAEAYEYITKADYVRGKFLPQESKLLFKDLADRYYKEHCLQFNHKPERGAYYKIRQAKEIFGNQLVSSITRQHVRELRTNLLKNWSAATVNRFINGVLKPIFNKGIDWELIIKNPIDKLRKLDEEDPIPRFLTTEEIKILFKHFKDDILIDFANIILHTGARPSSIEGCSFDTGDVDLPNKTIWFTTYKGRRKYRYAHPIDDVLYEIILRRLVATGGKGSVFDISRSRLDRLANKAVKESKINDGKAPKQHFTIYGLKHCYASHLLMSGAALDEVRRLLGLTDIKMLIKHYGHITQDHLRKVQARINLTPVSDILVEGIADDGDSLLKEIKES